jgi:hypothetical protein
LLWYFPVKKSMEDSWRARVSPDCVFIENLWE